MWTSVANIMLLMNHQIFGATALFVIQTVSYYLDPIFCAKLCHKFSDKSENKIEEPAPKAKLKSLLTQTELSSERESE